MEKGIPKPEIIVANEAFYDDQKLLWGTYIGLNDKKRTLIATIWGKNEVDSKLNAEAILSKLQ